MSTNGNRLNWRNLKSPGLINAKIELKKTLTTEVSNWIAENNLTQENAAVALGISHQRVSDVVTHKLSEFTVDSLVSMLVRAGKKVTMTVTPSDTLTSNQTINESRRDARSSSFKSFDSAQALIADRNSGRG